MAIGRRLPVVDDFVHAGMRMEHLYRRLSINNVDFVHVGESETSVFSPVSNEFNPGAMKQRLEVVRTLDSGARLGHFLTENRWQVEHMLEALVRPSRLVTHNREMAFARYSLEKLTPRFRSAVRGEPDPEGG